MNVLMYGAPETTPDVFHTIPQGIVDAFLYAEIDGRRVAAVHALDAPRVVEAGVEVIDRADLGAAEILRSGASRDEFEAEIALRACRRLGVEAAVVPPQFPIVVADWLRAAGVALTVDAEVFADRRRVKAGAELAGMRRAQAVADKAMALARHLVHELRPGLTSEAVRDAMRALCNEHRCDLPDSVMVSHGAQAAEAHSPGSGEIERGESVVVDIWPRDRASRCWADMTRTFVAGGGAPSEQLRRDWELTREAIALATAEVRAGAATTRVWEVSCEPFEAAGVPTMRTAPDGVTLLEGYFHAVGHGVGLEVHEAPAMGPTPGTLVAGDVVTVEPGCYRPGLSGVRLEDLVLVRDHDAEPLTSFPYDL